MKHAKTQAHLLAFAAGCALLAAQPARADRPLASETADAIAAGACQVELGHARIRVKDAPTATLNDGLFSCGLGRDSQVAVGYARATVDGFKGEVASITGKTSLVVPEPGRTGWGLRYGVAMDKQAPDGWKAGDYHLLGLMTREVSDGLLAHVNLGVSYSRADKQNTTVWSLGMETVGDLTFAGDVFGDDRDKPGVSAGVGYTFGRGFSANVSYALVFEKPRARAITLGAKLVF